MSIDRDVIGERIAAELRAELGRQDRSRRWLAEQTAHSHVSVSRWLAGGPIPLCTFLELCLALNVSPAAILARVQLPGMERRQGDTFHLAA